MGDITSASGGYSVPNEAKEVFRRGILDNPLIKPYLPEGWETHVEKIRFQGTAKPAIPINWRFAEGVSALQAYVALLINAIIQRRYGVDTAEVEIDTYGWPALCLSLPYVG